MAYDEHLADRIRLTFNRKKIQFSEKKMIGGLCFLVDDKMCCGIHIDKKYGHSLLMARIGENAYEEEISKDCCLPMDFTGRAMRGYLFVTPDGFDLDDDLEYWIDRVVAFNPEAKSSRKK